MCYTDQAPGWLAWTFASPYGADAESIILAAKAVKQESRKHYRMPNATCDINKHNCISLNTVPNLVLLL